MLKAVLWDMDGTLVDSEPLWGEVTYAMSEAMGRRLGSAQRAATVGGSVENTIRICAEHAGLDPATIDVSQWRSYMLDNVATLMEQRLALFPGVRELLTDITAHAIPMAICTNTERNVAAPAFNTIGLEYFATTICGDEVPQAKPYPDMYCLAAQQLGVQPADCLVFEDSEAGMTAAVAAGCVVIGVPEDTHAPIPAGVHLLRDVAEEPSYQGLDYEQLAAWHAQFRQSL
ncbi:MAG: HAD family phosphatase [Corynebacterium sp.]|nr:HAD family phosphatase [Corynebacterium sp.]